MQRGRIALGLAALLCVSIPSLAQKKEITISDLMEKGTFRAKSVSGINSMNDGVNYTAFSGGDIVVYSYQTGKAVDTILTVKQLQQFGLKSVSGYEFSADEKQLLLLTGSESVYRRSFTASYYIFNRATKA